MVKRKRSKYPGIKYEGINKYGQYIYKVSYYPYPDVRKWATIYLDRQSDKEANFKRNELIVDYRRNHKNMVNVDKQALSFEELEKCLADIMKADGCRPKTISRGQGSFKTFFYKFLNDKYPHIKKTKDFCDGIFTDYTVYFSKLEKRPKGWPSEAIAFKAMMKRLIRGGYCRKEFLEELKLIKVPKPMEQDITPLTPKEIKMMLGEIKREDYWAITYFLSRVGWRVSEVLSIRKENIKFIGGVPVEIVIPVEDRKNKKQFIFKNVDRKIAQLIIRFYRKSDSIWLFPNKKDTKNSYNHYAEYLREISTQVIKRRITSHYFRHTVVTRMLDAGVHPKNIMRITGHTDLEVLIKHYSHDSDKGSATALKITDLDI